MLQKSGLKQHPFTCSQFITPGSVLLVPLGMSCSCRHLKVWLILDDPRGLHWHSDSSAGELEHLRAAWHLFSTWWRQAGSQTLGGGSGQQDRKVEAAKPLNTLTQHHLHHILMVKANHKVQPKGKQIPPLDGRAAHARMGEIVEGHTWKQTTALSYTHVNPYTIQRPESDSQLVKIPVMALYPVSWFTFLNTFQNTAFPHMLIP